MTAVRTAAVTLLAALVLAVPARAATAPPGRPWATVNVCDTKAHPNAFGVRGSMPGLGATRRSHLYLRIQAEFQVGGAWRSLGASGDSGWLDAGRTGVPSRQTGRTFTITPPDAGHPAYVLRATVSFEWRRGTKVLRRATAVTTAGHRHVRGADPVGFSAATCAIA